VNRSYLETKREKMGHLLEDRSEDSDLSAHERETLEDLL
jgi:hypothetical protein